MAPRLTLLASLLTLLTPPPHPTPPTAISAIAPTLATAALTTLRSLGSFWRVRADAQLELIQIALTAIAPPAALPPPSRPSAYLLLLGMLAPLRAASRIPSLSTAYHELNTHLTALVSRTAGPLLHLLALDAAEGPPATQAAALSLLSALLPLQPPPDGSATSTSQPADGARPWTRALCGSGLLNSLTSSLAVANQVNTYTHAHAAH